MTPVANSSVHHLPFCFPSHIHLVWRRGSSLRAQPTLIEFKTLPLHNTLCILCYTYIHVMHIQCSRVYTETSIIFALSLVSAAGNCSLMLYLYKRWTQPLCRLMLSQFKSNLNLFFGGFSWWHQAFKRPSAAQMWKAANKNGSKSVLYIKFAALVRGQAFT